MKKAQYELSIHLCQKTGSVLYGMQFRSWCKHGAAALYQLVDYKELGIKSVIDDKIFTDLLTTMAYSPRIDKHCSHVIF